MNESSKIKAYFEQEHEFKDALLKLRAIFQETELTETFKWNSPVYTLNGKNVAGLARFKNHFGVWFFHGALLQDPKKLLFNAQEGKTKALRQLRYERISDIDKVQLKDFLKQAISNQKKGLDIKTASSGSEVALPDELKQAFAIHFGLEDEFHTLTPGLQKEYAEYITAAKQPKTRLSRLEKAIPLIKKRVGLNDKYKK
ncbi:YdeI/OmpD-associated family protein [Leeuwenhoekiella parthenopeia]|uniref:DUF1801 domain-containing protein n=1 Tax=Leeuwenhoekiella parthenopeia TaxID=2890320 RepID=A0ABS8GWR4_9FLAO|nr:DUF1801 domain-containing protein [Leeuwenhoekiella parthenopeia]MCC4213913.1 DUF1801 domain-containing protein [Leeuwenhoekiella parthenopeia]